MAATEASGSKMFWKLSWNKIYLCCLMWFAAMWICLNPLGLDTTRSQPPRDQSEQKKQSQNTFPFLKISCNIGDTNSLKKYNRRVPRDLNAQHQCNHHLSSQQHWTPEEPTPGTSLVSFPTVADGCQSTMASVVTCHSHLGKLPITLNKHKKYNYMRVYQLWFISGIKQGITDPRVSLRKC